MHLGDLAIEAERVFRGAVVGAQLGGDRQADGARCGHDDEVVLSHAQLALELLRSRLDVAARSRTGGRSPVTDAEDLRRQATVACVLDQFVANLQQLKDGVAGRHPVSGGGAPVHATSSTDPGDAAGPPRPPGERAPRRRSGRSRARRAVRAGTRG